MMFEGTIPGTALPSVVREYTQARATGFLCCKTDLFEKRISFWRGAVTSASSNLIDDRLGEVIYRQGLLSLDEFVTAAAKVTQKMRFGDVLVHSGILSPLKLWDALNSQSEAILTSLCFYPELQLSFENSAKPPSHETLLQFSIDQIFTRALHEQSMVCAFWELAKSRPALTIDKQAHSFVRCDFDRDMLGLVERNPDFNEIISKESRLSPIYTMRALYEIFTRGLIKDTIGFAHKHSSDLTQKLIREAVEDVNFMFAELANAAKVESVADWDKVVAGASQSLTRNLGEGMFVSPESGFLFDNILLACITQDIGRERAMKKDGACWPGESLKYIQDSLYSSVLFIFFELYQRKAGSEEFVRVKSVIDRMRCPAF